jgi:putative phosphoribosyl transferase
MVHTDHLRAFADRAEAGRALATELRKYAGRDDVIVLALPRGGVPIGSEVAVALGAPLDILVGRKLGTPGHKELAMGAIASGGVRVLNDEVVKWCGLTPDAIDGVTAEEQRELARRETVYRDGREALSVTGRIVILVDDGLATGSTMRAAVQAVKLLRPSKVVVAVPVGARETCRELQGVADEVVCARTPEPFSAVGLWYRNFDQTTDEEVRALLRSSAGPTSG